jgi:uncharacterized protein
MADGRPPAMPFTSCPDCKCADKLDGKNMKARRCTMLILAAACIALFARTALAQDEGPILKPNKPPAKASSASILVTCDLSCTWKLDGEAKGSIDAGGAKKASLSLGQHLVDAATADGLDKIEQEVDIKTVGQTIVRLEFRPVRDARLKAEQDARDKAAREQQRTNAAAQVKQGRDLLEQKRYVEARPLLASGCDGGNMDGCALLGWLYAAGQGVPQDYAQSATLNRKACDGGSVDGCNNLAVLYENGRGVPQDYTQARQFFQKACDGGNMRSCMSLGWLYQTGEGVPQDFAQALTFDQRACNGGNVNACNNLGLLYMNGHGVPRNDAQALALFERACGAGNMHACDNLGILYEGGRGVQQNYAEARSLFEKVCNSGDMVGCHHLGKVYQNGLGVRADKAQARALYKKACDGGLRVACDDLGKLR